VAGARRGGTNEFTEVEPMTALFSEVGVALVTVFGESGGVDPGSTGKLAADLTARGIRAVLVCGSTGEAATLSDMERIEIIEAVRAAVPAGVPVIAGTGAPSSRQAAALTRAAVRAGADAMLTWCPVGCTDLLRYFSAVREASGGRPVLAYHNPWMSCAAIPVDTLASLPVTGVKDSSGSPDRLLDELAHYPGETYVGSSAYLALAGPMGAHGALLALANVEPEGCARAFGGDAGAQRELADRHLEVRKGGPAAVKRILAATRGISPATRT
jgi:4-hydroxy-tetrahydrodipicolinate synthase